MQLCAITDRRGATQPLLSLVEEWSTGGVDFIQLREKDLSAAAPSGLPSCWYRSVANFNFGANTNNFDRFFEIKKNFNFLAVENNFDNPFAGLFIDQTTEIMRSKQIGTAYIYIPNLNPI